MSSDDSTIILILSSCIFIFISVVILVYIYITYGTYDTYDTYGTYGTYIDTNNKTQSINSLPASFTAKSINADYPGCIPKPNFNPVDKAPIICSKGMFNISGQVNDSDGFTTISAIAGKFTAQSPESTFTVKLTDASTKEYQDAQKLING